MVEIEGIQRPLNSSADNDLLIIAGIPALNEEKIIAQVILGAQKHADLVVVCDDGSSDLTSEVAARFGAIVVRHETNLGYGSALQSLFKKARDLNANVLVTLDADGQHDPSEILRLVKPIQEGVADVVLGSRFMDKKGTAEMPAYRQFGVKVITRLSNLNGKNAVSDAQTGFRAYSKKAINLLGEVNEKGMNASIELIRAINKSGLTICEVPISCRYQNGTGGETSTKHPVAHGFSLITYLLKLIVEDRPIICLGIPGIISLVVGTIFVVWMMNVYTIEHHIETSLALASIGFILAGFFAISTAITLYAIKRIPDKLPL